MSAHANRPLSTAAAIETPAPQALWRIAEQHTRTSWRMHQKPLELILARNFLTSLSTPAFLVDGSGALNLLQRGGGGAARHLLRGVRAHAGEEWSHAVGPFGDEGSPIPIEELPTTKALRQGRPAHGGFTVRSVKGDEYENRVHGAAHRRRGRPGGGNDLLLDADQQHHAEPVRPLYAGQEERGGCEDQMKLKVWGARGSVPAPGPEMNRYGGNTSCVELELSDGSTLIIDAGTGIRSLGVGDRKRLPKINISSPTCTWTTYRA